MLDYFLVVGFILLRGFYHQRIEFCQRLYLNVLRQSYNYLKQPRHKRVSIELIPSPRSDSAHLWYRRNDTRLHWRWAGLDMGTGKLPGLVETLLTGPSDGCTTASICVHFTGKKPLVMKCHLYRY